MALWKELRCSGYYLATLENFFQLLLMANVCSYYPLLKQGRWYNSKPSGSEWAAVSCSFFLLWEWSWSLCSDSEELLCRAPSLVWSFEEAEPIGASRCSFAYLLDEAPRGMGSLRRYVFMILTWVAYRFTSGSSTAFASMWPWGHWLVIICCIPPLFIAIVEDFLPW